MSGSNGLTPITNLAERTKCPTHPTKRKYTTSDEAKDAAERRARSTRLPIEAYLCPDCGTYHLTKSAGGDNVTLSGGKLTVGEFKALSPRHPVFSGGSHDEPEPDPIPANNDARIRVMRGWLALNPDAEPSTAEVSQILVGASREAVRLVMRSLGYRNTNGRTARWVKDESMNERPQAAAEEPNARWLDVDVNKVAHIAVGDLVAAYSAIGWDLHIEVRPRG
jgi:hypothetical protein